MRNFLVPVRVSRGRKRLILVSFPEALTGVGGLVFEKFNEKIYADTIILKYVAKNPQK